MDVMCFKVNFESDIRSKYLELLGYNKEELALKVRHVICSSVCEIRCYACFSVELVINLSICCQISAALEEQSANPLKVSLSKQLILYCEF